MRLARSPFLLGAPIYARWRRLCHIVEQASARQDGSQQDGAMRRYSLVLSLSFCFPFEYVKILRLSPLARYLVPENDSLLNGDVSRGDNLGSLIFMKPRPAASWQELHAAVSLPKALANFFPSFALIASARSSVGGVIIVDIFDPPLSA